MSESYPPGVSMSRLFRQKLHFPEFLTRIAGTRWAVLVLFLALHILYTVLVFAYLRHWPALKSLQSATGDLIHPTLVYNLLAILILAGVVMLWLGRLRPADIGLVKSQLPVAIGLTGAFWLAVQAGMLLSANVFDRPLQLQPTAPEFGIGYLIGGFFAQLLGNALYEEIAFRGFLLPQIFIKLRQRSTLSPPRILALAVILSQLCFALIHLPMLLNKDEALLLPLVWIFLGGIFLALLYLRTGNLWLVVGLHTLVNTPTPFQHTGFPPQAMVVALILLTLYFWRPQGRSTG